VAQHKAVAHQMALDRRNGAANARIFRRQEADRRQQKEARVEHRRASRIPQSCRASRSKPLAQTSAWIRSRKLRHFSNGALKPNFSSALDAAVEGDPGHDFDKT
jgi:hypothetical protein